MQVSVICTILNEGDAIRPLLDSLIDQTRPADEIIIVDGGSTDHTLEVLTEYTAWLPIRVETAEGANISEGRNIAIGLAKGPIVAATDAGVVLSPVWVEELAAPIENGTAKVTVSYTHLTLPTKA